MIKVGIEYNFQYLAPGFSLYTQGQTTAHILFNSWIFSFPQIFLVSGAIGIFLDSSNFGGSNPMIQYWLPKYRLYALSHTNQLQDIDCYLCKNYHKSSNAILALQPLLHKLNDWWKLWKIRLSHDKRIQRD